MTREEIILIVFNMIATFLPWFFPDLALQWKLAISGLAIAFLLAIFAWFHLSTFRPTIVRWARSFLHRFHTQRTLSLVIALIISASSAFYSDNIVLSLLPLYLYFVLDSLTQRSEVAEAPVLPTVSSEKQSAIKALLTEAEEIDTQMRAFFDRIKVIDQPIWGPRWETPKGGLGTLQQSVLGKYRTWVIRARDVVEKYLPSDKSIFLGNSNLIDGYLTLERGPATDKQATLNTIFNAWQHQKIVIEQIVNRIGVPSKVSPTDHWRARREELAEYVSREPDDAKARYEIAEYQARLLDNASALYNLERAIELDERYREKAKKSSAFDKLRDDTRFKKLVGE